ncbi:hypothetical protein TFA04_110099 [Tenacibaculum maritimum]|nr:hypothetical protein AQ1689_100056 [Tenacibaculum maritimum]CAA0160514.1 hypothetical protein JIP1097_110032 [Tenacibaculum maritimum]CAA0162981.1 hypothetical protein TFA04_110099 [Tenacibaculum maritimum]CAA0178348.1 hypothetical protein DPIF89300162_20028 [Tenacibaculum maritimum]CAA0201205.1 hypothetical protein AQ1688_80056 [Tenacibaculum maritimum]
MKKQKQKAPIGTLLQNVKILILITILILLPQQTYSQIVSIDLQNQKTVLDRKATIDKAKFVENEKRLRIANTKLLEIIRKQDSAIQSLSSTNISKLETIKLQNIQILKLSQTVQRYTEMQLGYEEKKKRKLTSLFFKLRADYLPMTNQYLPSTGLTYFWRKVGGGIHIGFFKDRITYGAEIAINVF